MTQDKVFRVIDCWCVYTALDFWHGRDTTGTRTIFIRAGTSYLHGPSTNRTGTDACFIRAVPKIECIVNGAYEPLSF